jgi:hypothetical protein
MSTGLIAFVSPACPAFAAAARLLGCKLVFLEMAVDPVRTWWCLI